MVETLCNIYSTPFCIANTAPHNGSPCLNVSSHREQTSCWHVKRGSWILTHFCSALNQSNCRQKACPFLLWPHSGMCSWTQNNWAHIGNKIIDLILKFIDTCSVMNGFFCYLIHSIWIACTVRFRLTDLMD